MQDAVDAHVSGGGAGEGRQQDATQRVTDGDSETALERLDGEFGVADRRDARISALFVGLGGLQQSIQHR